MEILQNIQRCFSTDKVFYTFHAREEIEQEELGRIFDREVGEAILHGEIIESYPEDEPYPSVLILGFTKEKRPLHIVCAYDSDDDRAIVITAYQPDPRLWIDYRRRKK